MALQSKPRARPRKKEGKKKLSPVLVELAKKGKLTPGSYHDGRGLMLKVDASSTRWVLRIQVDGKRHDYGLGSVQWIGLAEARERADERIKQARAGRDGTIKPLSFRDAARAVYELRRGDWKEGSKHVEEWWDQMENHILPALGNRMVGEITPAEMFDALTPTWTTIEETSRRLRQRCKLVFDWAAVKGHRSPQLVNPVAVLAALPQQTDEVEHHPAVQWHEAPAFLEAVRSSRAQEGARLALEFTLLVASRTAETIYATWPEFNLAAAILILACSTVMGLGGCGRMNHRPRANALIQAFRGARVAHRGHEGPVRDPSRSAEG